MWPVRDQGEQHLTDAVATLPRHPVSVELLGDAFLFLTVASSSIVMFEPAPYDLLLSIHAVVAFALGLALPRALAPLVVLLLLYDIGGILSMTQVVYDQPPNPNPTVFVLISGLLAVNAIFFAALTADRPYRMQLIMKATVAAAVLAALLGVVGWALKIEALTLFGRAKGTFKDPNVYGPFMVLPFVWLVRGILTERLAQSWPKLLPAVIILAGIFMSMSRAAWGLAAGCLVLLGLILFANERGARGRLRLIVLALVGMVTLALLMGAALSIEEVRNLFFERAKLVQDYDGARLGRFARHLIGFLWATELPLGIGPYQFDHYFPEDPHNVYLKSLMVYGWLGFVAYVALALWTIGKLFALMFKPRPWQAMAQVVWVVLTGHQIVSWVIDSDHWRHYYLMWGLAWGMIALEARHRRAQAHPRVASVPAPARLGPVGA